MNTLKPHAQPKKTHGAWWLKVMLSLFIASTLLTLLLTPLGVRCALSLTRLWLPSLHTQSSDGSLMQGVRLRGVRWTHNRTRIHVQSLALQWRLTQLVVHHRIQNITWQQLRITHHEPKPTSSWTLLSPNGEAGLNGSRLYARSQAHLSGAQTADLRLTLNGTKQNAQLKAAFSNPQHRIMLTGALQGPSLNLAWKDARSPKEQHGTLHLIWNTSHAWQDALKKRLNWTMHGQAVLPAYAFYIDHTRFNLNAQPVRWTASGNMLGALKKLSWHANLNLPQGNISMPQANLALTSWHIQLTQQAGHAVQTHVQAFMDKNKIDLNGKVQHTASSGFQGTWRIQGRHLLVWNSSSYRIVASPDLKLALHDHLLSLTGQAMVPAANITPPDLTQSLHLPGDIIYTASQAHHKTAKKTPWQFSMNLKISAGPQVYLNTQGIKGRIAGALTLSSLPNTPMLATGHLRILQGHYENHGEALRIVNGALHYTQAPMNNPTLAIQAEKSIRTNGVQDGHYASSQSVTVGVRLSGPMQNLTWQAYSPSSGLSQADILSYLAFNQPASDDGALSLNKLFAALPALSHSGKKASKLGLGLNELGVVNTQTVDAIGNTIGSQQNFVLGKQLSKHFYLRYTKSMNGNKLNTVSVNYQLSPAWSIQTESSSQGHGIDVFYTPQPKKKHLRHTKKRPLHKAPKAPKK